MDKGELKKPDLIRGSLLSELGGTALIYNAEFQGKPVVVKEARGPKQIPIIQEEHNFLIANSRECFEKSSEYGIPSDWGIMTRFVKVIPQAVSQEMYSNGIIVLEKVEGKSLINPITQIVDLRIPLKFHFAAITGWADMLKKLKKEDISMDSNIDTDLLLCPDPERNMLEVVRVDCSPSPGGAKSKSLIPSMTQEQLAIDQIIEILNSNYPPNAPHSEFMGLSVKALVGRFREGVIKNSDDFFKFLKIANERANWDNDFVKNGDNSRLKRWVDKTFD